MTHYLLITAQKRVFDYLPRINLTPAEVEFHRTVHHRTKMSRDLKVEWALKNAAVISSEDVALLSHKMAVFHNKGFGASLIPANQYEEFVLNTKGETPKTGMRTVKPHRTVN